MKNARGVPGRNVYINVNESSGWAGFVTLRADFWSGDAQKLANPGANFWQAAKNWTFRRGIEACRVVGRVWGAFALCMIGGFTVAGRGASASVACGCLVLRAVPVWLLARGLLAFCGG